MAREWHDIVLCVGDPTRGDIGFHLNVTLPEATSEANATERQIEAVQLFYQYRNDDLRYCQAHALLSCREYARLCCEAIFSKYPERVRRMLAPCLAAYITSDPEMMQFAMNWSERIFDRGTGSPRVRGTPFFADVQQFASYIEGCMDMNGWTLAQLWAVQ